MVDRSRIALVPAVLIASLAAAGTIAQERSSLHLSIAGHEIGADLQPRVVVERLRDGDEARITLQHVAAAHDRPAVSLGDAVDVIATAPNGTSVRVFNGFVSRISQGSRDLQSVIEITAAGPADVSTVPALVRLAAGGGGTLLGFAPRLSGTSSVQGVVVHALDAAGAPVTGRALAQTVPLGDAPAEPFGRTLELQSDRVFATEADADAFASDTLARLLTDRVSGEAVIEGQPELRVGSFVAIEGLNAEFDVEYYVVGVSHRFGHDSYGGFSSILRLRRLDLGMFRLPQIDDEVLVAFDHGDVDRPYVIDSWWNCDRRPRPGHGGSDPCRLLRWPW